MALEKTFKIAFDYIQTIGSVIIAYNYLGVNEVSRFQFIIEKI